MKLHGFWNDPEGLSFPEAISIVFTALYLAVTGLLLGRLLAGALTDQALDFYQILTWAMLTILGGWFGDRMLSRFGGSSLKARPRTRYWYGAYDYPYYGDAYEEYPAAGSEPVNSEPQEGGDRRGTI